MTTNLDIIARALRKIVVVPGGASPAADQAFDGMTSLSGMFADLIGGGTLGKMHDILATTSMTACEWDRIRASVGVVITLPTTVTAERGYGGGGRDYGFATNDPLATYGVTARAPINLSPIMVIDSNGAKTASLYVAEKGAWVTFSGLGQQDDFPLPEHLEEGFAALLAETVADDYGATVGPSTVSKAAACRQALALKPDNVRRAGRASYF